MNASAGTRSAESIFHVIRDPSGGAWRHVKDLARHQLATGRDVTIVCGRDRRAAEQVRQDPDLARAQLVQLRIGRAPGPADAWALIAVRRLLRVHRPDIVHGHGAKGGLIARLCRGGSGCIYTPHGGVGHLGGPTAKLLFLVERVLARLTDATIFVSEHERQTFESRTRALSRRRTVIYNGLDIAEFGLAVRADPADFDVLYVGALRDLKGVDVLVEAVDLLAQEARGLSVLIAGPGRSRDVRRYRSLIASKGLSDAVQVRDRPCEVRELTCHATLAVIPSRNEALGYLALELVAMGVPVVATSAGGLSEVFHTTRSNLVDPGNAVQLASAIGEALDDLPRLADLTRTRRCDLGSRFTVVTMTRETDKIYRSVLRGSRGGLRR